MDYNQRPFTVIWETTRACDLACIHCRAEANPARDSEELSFPEARKFITSIKDFGRPFPILVLTGGDPAKRPDIFDIIAHARDEGLRVAMTPSATPLVTRPMIKRLTESGLVRLAVSLDGKNAATHDGFRGVDGSFDRTMRILEWCAEFNLETQIHTTITKHVLRDLPLIAEMIAQRSIKLWALFLLIAVGRAARPQIRRLNVSAREIESLFNWLYDLAKSAPYDITTREGYHYRRVLLQRKAAEMEIPVEYLLDAVAHRALTPSELGGSFAAQSILRAPLGVSDGRGVVFISHKGDVQPSGFLNLVGGNIRTQSLGDIYRNSSVFRRLRDYSQITGKCAVCEFRFVCGGSRARAYALTGDAMQSDPYCVYQPLDWQHRKVSLQHGGDGNEQTYTH
jgi:radical SAM protein